MILEKSSQKRSNWEKIISQLEKYFFPVGKIICAIHILMREFRGYGSAGLHGTISASSFALPVCIV
ncbi:MAG: hypothetical protein ACI3X4_07920, partial [Bacteroidaceae bacterium]